MLLAALRAVRKYLCENTLYYNVMTIQCPKTCGRCGKNSSIPRIQIRNCADKSSDCNQKKDRCHNSAYANFMAQQCPFTCGKS
ncbi:hypothetical protein L596_022616 [Steinernema carpocapsae]|uniref:ShKT domain-containing protein n=1 Tax=Steinernema carpocapsae TaxID=34508 RepID=A0A4U5MN64_STECR|nr:hypothetical protein L596_022616 [Steinernema carpocapsae]